MRWWWILVALLLAIAASWLALRGSPRDRTAAGPTHSATASEEHPRDDALDPVEDDAVDEREGVQLPVASVADARVPGSADVGLEVRVIDLLDVPVAGARVRLESDEDVPEQITDAEGKCRIPREFGPVGHLFVIEAEGFFPLREYARTLDDLEFRLHRLVRLSGRVLERETLTPVAGARLWVPWKSDDGRARGVLSDAFGAFADLEAPAGANFHLAVRADGHLELQMGESAHTIRPEDPDPRLDVLLEKALVGEFLVVDSASEDPVADASIQMGTVVYGTDALGRVRVDRSLRVGAASHRISVKAPEHCWTTFDIEQVGDDAAPCVLRLPRAARIVGVLRDEQGNPATGVQVAAILDEALKEELRRSGRPPTVLATTNWPANASWVRNLARANLEDEQQGRFAIEGLPPGLPAIDLVVVQGELLLDRRRVGPLGEPGSTLVVDWRLAASEEGRVDGRLLLNGEPHRGFVHWTQGIRRGEVKVEEDGVFAIEDLAAGPLELRGEYGDAWTFWGPEMQATATVEVLAGQRVHRDLGRDLALATIRGILTGADGMPSAAAPVWAIERGSNRRARSVTQADGTWSVIVPEGPGIYRIDCDLPLRERDVEVRAGADGVELHVSAVGTLRFRTREAESERRIASIALQILGSGGFPKGVAFPGVNAPDADGWVEVEIPEGEHTLLAWSADGAWLPERRTVRVHAGAVSEIDLWFVAAQSLSLRLDPAGGPIPPAHVCLILPEGDWPLVTAEWRDDRMRVDYGTAAPDPGTRREAILRPGSIDTLRGLAPGRYRFKVFPDDVRIDPEWIDVPAPGVVDVRWSPKP